MGAEAVHFYVGPEEKCFLVHKKLICDNVKAFDRMFNGDFKESQTLTAKLPEDDAAAFDLFVSWLYSGTLPPFYRSLIGNDAGREELYARVHLYYLAEKYEITVLLDSTMDAIIDWFHIAGRLPAGSTICEAYENTRTGSKLRVFMVRCLTYIIITFGPTDMSSGWPLGWPLGSLKKSLQNDDICEDFLKQVGATSGEVVKDPRTAPPCHYHVHGGKKRCVWKWRPDRDQTY